MASPSPQPPPRPAWNWSGGEPNNERRVERPRGLLHLGIGLAAAGLLALLGHRRLALIPLAVGLLGGFLALVLPQAMLRVEGAARRFGLAVGRLLGLLLIGLTMVLLFAPTGLFLRWRGKLRLAVRPQPGPQGYWRSVDPAPSDYRRQF